MICESIDLGQGRFVDCGCRSDPSAALQTVQSPPEPLFSGSKLAAPPPPPPPTPVTNVATGLGGLSLGVKPSQHILQPQTHSHAVVKHTSIAAPYTSQPVLGNFLQSVIGGEPTSTPRSRGPLAVAVPRAGHSVSGAIDPNAIKLADANKLLEQERHLRVVAETHQVESIAAAWGSQMSQLQAEREIKQNKFLMQLDKQKKDDQLETEERDKKQFARAAFIAEQQMALAEKQEGIAQKKAAHERRRFEKGREIQIEGAHANAMLHQQTHHQSQERLFTMQGTCIAVQEAGDARMQSAQDARNDSMILQARLDHGAAASSGFRAQTRARNHQMNRQNREDEAQQALHHAEESSHQRSSAQSWQTLHETRLRDTREINFDDSQMIQAHQRRMAGILQQEDVFEAHQDGLTEEDRNNAGFLVGNYGNRGR